jgi:hypothetical protein
LLRPTTTASRPRELDPARHQRTEVGRMETVDILLRRDRIDDARA